MKATEDAEMNKTDNLYRDEVYILADNLEGWDQVGGGRRFNREGAYIYTYD